MRALSGAPLTEDGLVAAVVDALGQPPRALRVGIGDDAAAFKAPSRHLTLVTTDMLVDGVHFRLAQSTAQSVGHKALAVNLSDIAAMGGSAVMAVVALGVTPAVDEAWVRSFYAGMATLAKTARCAIGGGDIVRSPVLTLGVTAIGDVRASNLRLRSGAKIGDVAAVTGPLGLAAAGLRAIDAGSTDRRAAAVSAYLSPQPRMREGAFLGSRKAVRAMMDVSDGLSTDIARMARASGLDAIVERDRLAAHADVAAAGGDPVDTMLNGGDDYELLAAIDRRAYAQVARTFERRFRRPLVRVGRFAEGNGSVWLETEGRREPLEARGYDHLMNRS